jgi:hypothetical protein
MPEELNQNLPEPQSPYSIQENESYRLVRAEICNGVVFPTEFVPPCHAVWECQTPEGQCASFRGFNAYTKLVGCAAQKLMDVPIDHKRFVILIETLNRTTLELGAVLRVADEATLDKVIAGKAVFQCQFSLQDSQEESLD